LPEQTQNNRIIDYNSPNGRFLDETVNERNPTTFKRHKKTFKRSGSASLNNSVAAATMPIKKKLKKGAGFTAFENSNNVIVGVSVMATRKEDQSNGNNLKPKSS
jgi:hypothetical protein